MTLLPEVWTQTLGWTLVHSLWQLTMIAVGLRLLLWIIPHRSSRFRYSISVAVLLLAFGALLFTGYRVYQTKVDAQTVASLVSDAPVLHASADQAPPADSWTLRLMETRQTLQVWLSPHLSGVLVLWFSGMLFFLIRTIGKVAYLHRLTRKETHPLPAKWEASVKKLREALKMKRKVLVRTSARIRTPFVAGLFKPIILLPVSSFTQLNYEQLEAILAHELAHIRRWDDVINWLQTVIEIVLFYHPAIWWISQTIRDEREKCCDDLAVSVCGNPLVYAKALAQMETLQQSTSDLALAFARQGAGLLARIERLLQPSSAPSRTSVAPAVIAGLLLLSFLISYRMSSSFSHTTETEPKALYSGAILRIPQLQGSKPEIAATYSPWQPKLPEWLMKAEAPPLDTIPNPDHREIEVEIDTDIDVDTNVNINNDIEVDKNINVDTLPRFIWKSINIDTLSRFTWKSGDSLAFHAIAPIMKIADIAMINKLTDTSIIWKSDSSFHYQFKDIVADTLFPPLNFNHLFDIPMPPMPVFPDSLGDFSFDFDEGAFEHYQQLFEHLDSAGVWDQIMEQQQGQLEEQQKHLEEQLQALEAQQEQQQQEWQNRLEEWEKRQEEQLRHYEEQVKEWEERTRKQQLEREQQDQSERELRKNFQESQPQRQNLLNLRQQQTQEFQQIVQVLAEKTQSFTQSQSDHKQTQELQQLVQNLQKLTNQSPRTK
ncbi:MAG: M56 family metallopeptidase [Cyclobacteriaceae bacterium]